MVITVFPEISTNVPLESNRATLLLLILRRESNYRLEPVSTLSTGIPSFRRSVSSDTTLSQPLARLDVCAVPMQANTVSDRRSEDFDASTRGSVSPPQLYLHTTSWISTTYRLLRSLSNQRKWNIWRGQQVEFIPIHWFSFKHFNVVVNKSVRVLNNLNTTILLYWFKDKLQYSYWKTSCYNPITAFVFTASCWISENICTARHVWTCSWTEHFNKRSHEESTTN